MNTLVWTGIFVAIVFATTASARKVPIAKVGLKTFYTIEGKDDVWWPEALNACANEDLQMAVIENRAESHALSAYLRKLVDEGSPNNGMMWLGAYLKNGKWFWAATREELTYTNWNPDADLNNPATSPTNGYECGYMNGGLKWGTWTCGVGRAIVVCQ